MSVKAMERLCDLELGLRPPTLNHEDQPRCEATHRFTIMYNGVVCVCDDVSEARARAIFLLASRAAEEGERRSTTSGGGGGSVPSSSEGCNGSGSSAMSMKRSLQRFLEKRKLRLQRSAASPY